MQLLLYATIGLIISSLAGCAPPGDVATEGNDPPKVILIIGDGMDDQQISIARNYLAGSSGRLAVDTMQYRGAIKPLTVREDHPGEPVYVTGSAPAATAMATGILSSGQRISTYPQTGQDAVTIMELANKAGIATGVVTTASVTDATPASFMAHTGHRSCQGPDNMDGPGVRTSYDCGIHRKSHGGKGSIAEQIADGDIDIVLGGGRRHFDQTLEGDSGASVMDLARENGFEVITEREELQSIPLDRPVLGLFSPGLMPPLLRGNGATSSGDSGEPYACEDNPEFDHLPRLAEMAETAIRHLETRGSFMLVIEDEAIDEHAHRRQPCGHVGGVAQIDETLSVVMQYAESHPELLVIVTADHGHAAQIISPTIASGQGANFSPGHAAQLITADGSVMGINYTTARPNSGGVHTGVQVPLLASGPGVNQWPVFMLQTELFHIAKRHFGLDD